MYTEQYCDNYYASLIPLSPIYCWGANMEQATSELMQSLYQRYGSSKYNQQYYQDKLIEAQNGCGLVSDCSGMIFPISQADNTAQGYYNNCVEKGDISSIDLSRSCLVFRGTSAGSISHIGYYNHSNGQVQEMANSDTNFRSKTFSTSNWNYWGKPKFIDYSSASVPASPQYLYKGVDISSYQKGINYQALKNAGVDFAILKIINKNGDMDSGYAVHSAALDALGIKIQAVYNYSYATTVDKAVSDANRVLQCLGNRQCAVCLDVEDNVQKGLGYTLIDIINAYQNVIERTGRAFILYSGKSFYETYIKPYSANLKCKQLWIARYYKGYNTIPFGEDPDESYKPMGDILAWQYTSSGIINGINTRLDLDVMYKEIELPSVIVPVPTIPTIPTEKLNPIIKNTVSTGGKNLNVRTKPSTNGQIIGKLPNNSNVIIYGTDKEGKWARISVPNDEWCSLEYISSTGRGMVTAEKSLNVRSSDSTSGDIWGVYKGGEVVTLLHRSTNTGWYLTVGKSKDGTLIGGWCSDKYIRTQ